VNTFRPKSIASPASRSADLYRPQNYTVYYNVLVNDPNSSVREGDIITMTPERHSKHVMHTVSQIVAPYGIPISQRPPLATPEERESAYLEKRVRKLERRRKSEASSGVVEKAADAVLQGKDSSLKDRGNKTNEVRKQSEHGRMVLPGGKHKFGKINDEATRGKRKVEKLDRKTAQNEAQRQVVAAEDGAVRAKQALTQ
jgi:hypothetical protein